MIIIDSLLPGLPGPRLLALFDLLFNDLLSPAHMLSHQSFDLPWALRLYGGQHLLMVLHGQVKLSLIMEYDHPVAIHVVSEIVQQAVQAGIFRGSCKVRRETRRRAL